MMFVLWFIAPGLVLAGSLVFAPPTSAQVQSRDQRRCIRTLNHGFERMLKAQAGEVRRCLKDAAKERLQGSLDECLRADGRRRVYMARTRNIAQFFERCVEAPDFGPRDIATSNAAGIQSQSALLLDLFGSDLQAAIALDATDHDTAKCQRAVYGAVDACQRAKLTSLGRCLEDGNIASETDLDVCLDEIKTPSPGGVVPISHPNIGRRCGAGKIQWQLERRCAAKGIDLTQAFPGGAGGDAAGVTQYLDHRVECRVCLALNRVDFANRDCDAFDDGAKNESCLGFDRWGGHTSVESTATGRFRVEEIDGVWYFITPDGHGFFSAGVDNVNPNGDFSPPTGTSPYEDNILALYGNKKVWQEVAYERLQRWNFNTIGAFGPTSIHVGRRPYTPLQNFDSVAPEIPGWPPGQTGKRVRDYFDPGWPAAAAQRAEGVRYCAEDPFCIGVYSNNELPWGPGVFMVGTFTDAYMSLPAGAPGKLALQTFMEERYGNVAAFNAAWGLGLASFDELQNLDSLGSALACESRNRTDDRRAFMVRVAERYFGVVHDALRALSPDLLILGTRFTTTAVGPDVIQAAAPYQDVISLNHYLLDAGALNIFAGNGGVLYDYFFLNNRFADLDQIHAIAGRPLMITEYSIRTPTPGAAVLFPPFFPTFDTQAARAAAYEEYQRQILSRPFMIGAHWFEYWDEPDTGRGDGENSRFGVVNIEDTPYEEITRRMMLLNGLTPQRPLPAPDPVIFPDPSAAAASTLNLTRPATMVSAPAEGALGARVFSIAPPGSDRTGFYVGILPGQNMGGVVTGGPLLIEAGIPDQNGDASLALGQDEVLAIVTVVGDVLCLRLDAAGSSGTLSCTGGTGHDVSVTRDTGELAGPAITQTFLGTDSGPGAATLLVPTEVAQLPGGADVADCLTTDLYDPPQLMALSTGMVTITKGSEQLILQGENFVCGADGTSWQLEDGPGMLGLGLPVFDGRVPGGDLASGLLFADRADACP